MKKVIIFFIFFLSFTFNVKAEIKYIDINFILNSSEVGKSLNAYIKKIKNNDLVKYKKIESELISKEKSLISQQNILDKKEFQNKLSILTSEVQKFRSDKQLSLEKLNNIKIERTKEILKVLNPIITNYVELNSISIVIPKKNIIVGKKNLDITDDITKLLNKKITELKF